MQIKNFKVGPKKQAWSWLGLILIGSASVHLWAQEVNQDDIFFLRLEDTRINNVGGIVISLRGGFVADNGKEMDSVGVDNGSLRFLGSSLKDSRPRRGIDVYMGEGGGLELVGSELWVLDERGRDVLRVQFSRPAGFIDDPADPDDLGIQVMLSYPVR